MGAELELVAEKKLHKLLPGQDKKSRLEATTSAVAGQLDQTIERLQRLLKD